MTYDQLGYSLLGIAFVGACSIVYGTFTALRETIAWFRGLRNVAKELAMTLSIAETRLTFVQEAHDRLLKTLTRLEQKASKR